MDTIVAALEDIALHLEITVFGAEMNFGSKHHLYICFFCGERFRGRHCCCGGNVRLSI